MRISYWSSDVCSSDLGNRCRLVRRTADEAHDLGRRLDEMPGVLVHVHLDQNVAREELALGGALDAFLDLDHFLGRHQDVAKLLLQSGAIDALLERLHHRILILRVSGHDLPAHRHLYPPRPVRNTNTLASTPSTP